MNLLMEGYIIGYIEEWGSHYVVLRTALHKNGGISYARLPFPAKVARRLAKENDRQLLQVNRVNKDGLWSARVFPTCKCRPVKKMWLLKALTPRPLGLVYYT